MILVVRGSAWHRWYREYQGCSIGVDATPYSGTGVRLIRAEVGP